MATPTKLLCFNKPGLPAKAPLRLLVPDEIETPPRPEWAICWGLAKAERRCWWGVARFITDEERVHEWISARDAMPSTLGRALVWCQKFRLIRPDGVDVTP